jgi:hypothetical protein
MFDERGASGSARPDRSGRAYRARDCAADDSGALPYFMSRDGLLPPSAR